MNQRRNLLRLATAMGWATLAACAETAAPPEPPEELVVVLNTTSATLSLVPVTAPTQISTVPVGASDVMPVNVPPGAPQRSCHSKPAAPSPWWTFANSSL